MKKSIFIAMLAMVAATFAAMSVDKMQPAPAIADAAQQGVVAAASAGDDDVVLYSYMTQSNAWGAQGSQWSPQFGIYEISLNNRSYKRVYNSDAKSQTDGGFYLDGRYHYVYSYPIGAAWKAQYGSSYTVMDLDTWMDVDGWNTENEKVYATDMTYNYIDGCGYAVGPSTYGSDNPMTQAMLKRVDPATGVFTEIGQTGAQIKAIAADGSGQLWGIGNGLDTDSKTYLFRIDKSTGAATKVNQLNVRLYSASSSSATFDLRTGKLYWVAITYVDDAQLQRTFTSGVYEINLSTGAATLRYEMTYNEIFNGTYMVDTHPKAPEAASNLDFAFDTGSINTGKVTFTAPSRAYDRSSLSGTLSADITVDGSTTTVTGLTPGASYVGQSQQLGEGSTHHVKVVCYQGERRSLPAKAEVFAGVDVPAAVTDIHIEATKPYAEATVSWTAPTMGAAGGYIDQSSLTYTVTRKPDNKVIATGLTTTSYHDVLDRVMGVTQYEITATAGGKQSASAYSSTMLLGKAYSMPYIETFDTNTKYLSYTTIDANGDGDDTNGGAWFYDPSSQLAFYYTNQRQADDWLITPTLDLDPNKVYRLQYQTCGYMETGNVHYTVTIGDDATVEAQTHLITEETYPSKSAMSTCYYMFRPNPGENRIAFHNIGNGDDHLMIDNVVVSVYGSVDIPQAPSDLTFAKEAGGIAIEFTAPSLTVGGSPIASLVDCKIYRAGASTPIGVVANPTPGSRVKWIDATPATGANHYVVVATNAAGAGIEIDGVTTTFADVPRAVENIRVEGRNAYTIAEITWEQSLVGVNDGSLSQSDIVYDIYRLIGVNRTLIAENSVGTSYVDRDLTAALGARQQQMVQYLIRPKTNGGAGGDATSTPKLLGKTYELPYTETFAEQSFQTFTWRSMNESGGGYWGIVSTGYDPYTQGHDGYGLMSFMTSAYNPVGQADWVSPRIDVSSYVNPTVSFWVYRSNDTATYSATLQVGVYTDEDGVVMCGPSTGIYSDTSGWQQVTMAIPARYADCDHLSIVFRGKTNNQKGSIHLDDISVTGSRAPYEVRVEQLLGGEEALIGRDNTYIVGVRNLGSSDNSNIKVKFFVEGELIDTKTIASLASGIATQLEFVYSPSLDNVDRLINVAAEIEAANDESTANNRIETTVNLVAPMLPIVNDLTAVAAPGRVHLQWSDNNVYPHVEYTTTDLESLPAFAITDVDGWKFIDVDKAMTTKLSLDGQSAVMWEHTGEPQAFIVFNSDMTALTSIITPHSGNQCFVCFEAVGTQNDDWLISPLLSGDEQILSFYAKALYPYSLDERFEIWVSESTADDVAKFRKVSGNAPVVVDDADVWHKFQFTLPEGSRYFAIRCVSYRQFGLMIDDITYSPVHKELEFWGYNVYRDGQLLTDEAIGDLEFDDTTADLSGFYNYRYNVTALYDDGESIFSNHAIVYRDAAVDVVGADAVAPSVTAVSGGVVVEGAKGQMVRVYGTGGTLLYALRGSERDFLPLAPGIYLVEAGPTHAKLHVR